jgi:hypothetical protein
MNDPMTTTLDRWDASTGGNWRYVTAQDGKEFGFHGCFHEGYAKLEALLAAGEIAGTAEGAEA